VIEVQHLTKRYGPVTAVDDVSFKAERGEILGFLGPNGAGKTTTMRVLTGYMPATDGKAIVAGYDVLEQPVEAKRRTGYLPETPPLYPDMTVSDYLAFCARIKGVPRSERATRLKTVMERTQIADVANRHCSKLSKGYRQRVGLAQALLHNPEVLILDEPTAGLDPKQIIETRRLIKGLGGDHTIILSTHILPEVSQTCNRIVIIYKGRIAAVDTPDNLTARLRGAETTYVQVDAMGSGWRLVHEGGQAEALVLTPRQAELYGLMPVKAAPDTSKFLLSPMPGLLASVAVGEGQEVKAGEPLAVVEAMKMENVLRAAQDGTVKTLHAKAGDSLKVDQKIIEFA